MKLTTVLLLASTSFATAATASESPSSAETECRAALAEEQADELYQTHFGRCECEPASDDEHGIDSDWNLRCVYNCEMCLDETCVIMTKEDTYRNKKDAFGSALAKSESCFFDRGNSKDTSNLPHDKFCFATQGLLQFGASIDHRMCTGSIMCPDGSYGLFHLICSNLGLLHNTCTKTGIEELGQNVGGPVYFFARLFIDESEEEPAIGMCHDPLSIQKIIQTKAKATNSHSKSMERKPCLTPKSYEIAWKACLMDEARCPPNERGTHLQCVRGIKPHVPVTCSQLMEPICEQMSKPPCQSCPTCREIFWDMYRCNLEASLVDKDLTGELCSWDCHAYGFERHANIEL